ncbi:hypothetical protein RclHR1_12160011 [Rhizophagus clarus]|uniref:Uncharacterized protein n=1 Tax=Rhizophagus clarus TaxID=94130 RepID=A0A2Z6QZC3_9GLOM|nr:hypothetical protein RclHR1_12160011 [Rhizophagus clarus]GES86614.1 hypothetical protein RCL_e26551_RclHR1_12160011 [Rhizophagus clarus]
MYSLRHYIWLVKFILNISLIIISHDCSTTYDYIYKFGRVCKNHFDDIQSRVYRYSTIIDIIYVVKIIY